jgi:DUF4097 and DUF4098 domain-containing protein YvlB
MERFHRTIERRFEAGAEVKDVRIEVAARNGDVLIEGAETSEIRVVAVVDVHADSLADAERDVRAVEEGIRADGGHVGVMAPSTERPSFFLFGRGLKVDYRISAPRRAVVQVSSRNGRVDVSDFSGEVNITSRNGSVRIERLGGPAQVTGNNGRIEAVDCGSDVKLTSRNGHVSAKKTGGELAAETCNGEVSVEDASRGVKLRTYNGSLRYAGAVGGNFDLEVEGNGSIRFGVPPASRFELDAEAVRGDVKSDLVVKESAAPGLPRPLVRLRTLNGSIKVNAIEAAS